MYVCVCVCVVLSRKEPLPPSLSGMINKYGTKVRLHFKMELEQLWLGTHGEKHLWSLSFNTLLPPFQTERTEKIPLGSIRRVVSEAIKGHEEYHIMVCSRQFILNSCLAISCPLQGVQLGPTEASLYWIYWVPAQYIEAIKEAVFGKWQFY